MSANELRSRRWPYAASGLLAAAAGSAAGHLVAGWVAPSASPVLAIGSTVIDATPTPVKEWAVAAMGTADKPVLIGSVLAVTLGLAAGAGVLARRSLLVGQALLAGLTVLATVAAALRPGAGLIDLLPGAVTMLVGVGVLTWLASLLRREAVTQTVRESTTQSPPESPTDHNARPTGTPTSTPRRDFLLAAGGVGAATAVMGAVGQSVASGADAALTAPLPRPATPLGPLVSGLESRVKDLTPFRTPTADFYRIDTALVIPRVSPDSWRLRVDGDVDAPFELTYDELTAMDLIEKDITMCCVSNEVGGGYVGAARWLGVPVRKVLEKAGIRDNVDQILSTSADGMTISTPTQALTDDRDALLAIGMNGAPLPRRHGFPVRLVTPRLYGFVGSTKWLTRLTATTYAAQQAYWTQRDWATDGRIHTQSRIDTPRGLAQLGPGKVVIGGVAWAQGRGISKVEVQIDDTPWQAATLGPDANIDYWRQWFLEWDAPKGSHQITVRAVDGEGAVQTQRRAAPFPRGATGWHTVPVNVS